MKKILAFFCAISNIINAKTWKVKQNIFTPCTERFKSALSLFQVFAQNRAFLISLFARAASLARLCVNSRAELHGTGETFRIRKTDADLQGNVLTLTTQRPNVMPEKVLGWEKIGLRL